jgi:glycerophosphoryl diester phosphodiesterase
MFRYPKDLPDFNKIEKKKGNCVSIPLRMCNSRFIKKIHKFGMKVVVWFYMKDKEDMNLYRRLRDYKVDVLITNYPNLL